MHLHLFFPVAEHKQCSFQHRKCFNEKHKTREQLLFLAQKPLQETSGGGDGLSHGVQNNTQLYLRCVSCLGSWNYFSSVSTLPYCTVTKRKRCSVHLRMLCKAVCLQSCASVEYSRRRSTTTPWCKWLGKQKVSLHSVLLQQMFQWCLETTTFCQNGSKISGHYCANNQEMHAGQLTALYNNIQQTMSWRSVEGWVMWKHWILLSHSLHFSYHLIFALCCPLVLKLLFPHPRNISASFAN